METFKGCFMEEETLNDDKISSVFTCLRIGVGGRDLFVEVRVG